MFFKNFDNIKQIIIMAVLFYITIIFILRIAGKRTLSQFNAYDFVVTVTIGSIASTTILSENTPYLDGFTAVATLVILQYLVTKLDTRFKFIGKILKSQPTLLYYRGEYLEKNMIQTRITEKDILQEIRKQDGSVLEEIEAVILESDGKISVISGVSNENLKKLKDYK